MVSRAALIADLKSKKVRGSLSKMNKLNLRARGTIMKFLQQCTRPRI